MHISQFLSIVNEINSSVDFNPISDGRGDFLEIPKPFDNVWHPGLPEFITETITTKRKFFNLLSNYFCERSQLVVLNGQRSTWNLKISGAPKGLVLGPLPFLIYIFNVLQGQIRFTRKIFVDDTFCSRQSYDKQSS